MCKLLLNSLYGKTGQEIFNKQELMKKETFINTLKNKNFEKVQKMRSFDEHILVEYKSDSIHPLGYGSLVYLANFITSKARLGLFKGINDIIKNNGKVYYCDTDSIYSDIKMSPEFLDENELGKWKMEKEISKGRFFGSKCYIIKELNEESTLHLKGIAKQYLPDVEQIWTWDTEKILQANIATTWIRKFGFVLNKPMEKKIRTTLNRRKYLNNSSVCL